MRGAGPTNVEGGPIIEIRKTGCCREQNLRKTTCGFENDSSIKNPIMLYCLSLNNGRSLNRKKFDLVFDTDVIVKFQKNINLATYKRIFRYSIRSDLRGRLRIVIR